MNFNDNVTLQNVAYGHAVMAGFETSTFATNLTACYDGWMSYIFTDIKNLEIFYHYGNTNDKIFNTT